jgi:hypothetical protein
MEVKRRQFITLFDKVIDARATIQETCQRILALKDYPATSLLRQKRVADELNCVAEPLFGMNQEGLSFQRTPIPQGLGKVPGRKSLCLGLLAPFIL